MTCLTVGIIQHRCDTVVHPLNCAAVYDKLGFKDGGILLSVLICAVHKRAEGIRDIAVSVAFG